MFLKQYTANSSTHCKILPHQAHHKGVPWCEGECKLGLDCVTPAAGDLCGIPTIDLHTPTSRLVEQLPKVAANMTHDGVHWSRAVNLVFAQKVLRTILQHC
jgi:hypothetical protein